MRRVGLAAVTCSFLILISLNSVFAQGAVVVPSSLTNVEGNIDNGYPFNCNCLSMRYQQVYLGSEIGSLNISSINFRLESSFPSAFEPAVLPDVRIDLSTTQAVPGGLDSIFANNIGPDNTTVFFGDLTLSAPTCTVTPCPFDITIPLQTPFSFDPSTGNLLLDVRIPTAVDIFNVDLGFVFFDATNEFGNITSRVSSVNVNSPDGTVDNIALVTQFVPFTFVSNIPTLSEWGLIALAAGLGMFGVFVLRKNKKMA
ncbi:MAG: IPTL-CTERM sorting domain-containing protein [Thermodesulfobacteriota bacterium]